MMLEMRELSLVPLRMFRQLKSRAFLVIQYVRNLLRQISRGPSEGWMTFLLLLLSVLLAAWSVGSVLWLPAGFYVVVLCSVALGLLFAKIRINGWLLVTGGLLVGLTLSFYKLMGQSEGLTRFDRLAEVYTRLITAWQAFVSGGASTDRLAFGFAFLLVSWSLGFISSWFLFRKHNVWGALLPGGITVSASLASVASGDQTFRLYLYLAVALLLSGRLFNLERQQVWDSRGVQRYPRGSKLGLHDAFLLVVVVMLVTSLLPVHPGGYAPMATTWTRVGYPVRVIEGEIARLVGGLPVKEQHPTYAFGPTQAFGGPATLGQTPVLMVEAPFSMYLRARSYDVYTRQGWMTSDTSLVSPVWASEDDLERPFRKTNEVELTVTSRFVLRAGEAVSLGGRPVEMSIDYRLEVLEAARYRILIAEVKVDEAVETSHLPLDLQRSVAQLRGLHEASTEPLTEAQIRSVLPEDVLVVSWEYSTEGVEAVTLERQAPMQPDPVSVRSAGPLEAGGSYRAVVRVSTATEDDLRAAGTAYPGWILDRYLQLPETLSSRIAELAWDLTREAETPYEKAVTIRDYLRTMEYTLDIQAPPYGSCGVEYFLFELREGYCQYFSSAMAVLLRVSGVPARVTVGYAPDEVVDARVPRDIVELPWPDEIVGYLPGESRPGLRVFAAVDSHSWCEVFFPEYGWVLFEPSPSYPVVTRISTTPAVHGDGQGGADNAPGRGEDAGTVPGAGDGEAVPDGVEGANATTPRYPRSIGALTSLSVLSVILWLLWKTLLGQVGDPRLAYLRMGRLATLSKLAPQANSTPWEYGRRLSAAMPQLSADLDTVVGSYVRVCYGRYDLTNDDRSRVTEAWPRIRRELMRRAIAVLWPRRFWW